MGFDAARARYGNLESLGLDRAGVDVARAGNLIVCRLRRPRAGLHAAGAGDGQLQLLHAHRGDIDAARARDRAVERRARDLVDLDVARAGDARAVQLRNGDREVRRSAVAEAPVEEVVAVFGADHELVALNFDNRALEQLLAAAGGNGSVRAGADVHVVRSCDLDR